MVKGKLILGLFLVTLLGIGTPMLILSTMPTTELQTMTSNDVTVTTDPRSGLYITFSKGEQTSVVKLWSVQEKNTEGVVTTQLDISGNSLTSHELTAHKTPTTIVLMYLFHSKTSASGKPPILKITVSTIENGITVQLQLIDFEITGRDNTFVVNYERDNVANLVSFDSYTFTMTFEFVTAKSWFSAIPDFFAELFAPKEATEDIAA